VYLTGLHALRVVFGTAEFNVMDLMDHGPVRPDRAQKRGRCGRQRCGYMNGDGSWTPVWVHDVDCGFSLGLP